MADFGHGPNVTETESPAAMRRNSRAGLVLFAVYLLLYGGFVALNAFAPERMERPAIAGLNLAVTYGLVLIAAAFVMALLYGWLCRNPTVSEPAVSRNETERPR